MSTASDALLRSRAPLFVLLAANALSSIGSVLTVVALPWFVLETTGSAARAGLTGAFVILPSFLVGVFGGTLVDRFGFKRTAVTADLVDGLGVLAIPLLYHGPGLQFWQLLGFVFLGHLMAVPGLTARRSMLPELAERAGMRLERANTLFEANQQLSYLLGPPLAGILIAWLGASNVLWIDAATFAVSALAVAVAVPAMTAKRSANQGSYAQGLAAGLRFLRADRVLFALAVSLFVTNFLGNPLFAVVLPVYAQEQLGSPRALGFILGAFGAGALLGTLAYGWFAYRLSRRTLWITGFVAGAAFYWVFLPDPPVAVVMTVLFLTALIGGPLNPLAVTVRHERIPVELRGRVFSTFSAIAMAAAPLGIAMAGVLIDAVGFRATVLVLAVAYQIVGLAMLAVPAFRELDATRPTPSDALGR